MVLWVSSERSVRALGGAPQEEAEAQTWGRVRGGEAHLQGRRDLRPPPPHRPPKAGYLVGAVGKTPPGPEAWLS